MTEKIGGFGIRDEKRSYCRGKGDQCDDWKIVQVVIGGWTRRLVQSGFDQKDDWTGQSFAYNLEGFEVQLIHRIGGGNLGE